MSQMPCILSLTFRALSKIIFMILAQQGLTNLFLEVSVGWETSISTTCSVVLPPLSLRALSQSMHDPPGWATDAVGRAQLINF